MCNASIKKYWHLTNQTNYFDQCNYSLANIDSIEKQKFVGTNVNLKDERHLHQALRRNKKKK